MAFAQPPPEYGTIHWAIWGGQQTKERIQADIERLAANGVRVYMINNSQRVMPAYLSPEYLDLVKFVVDECKKRGMKVWIEGDCGYPDGFAGGLISRDYPELGQQGIVGDARRCAELGQQAEQLTEDARNSLRADDESAARLALLRKQEVVDVVGGLEQQLKAGTL